MPHFSRPLREVGALDVPRNAEAAPSLRVLCARVGTTDAGSVVFEVDVAFDVARVERILLSVAFDVGSDFDVDLDFDPNFRVTTKADTTVEERRLSAA
jgi:hypothetical protein